MQYNNSFIYIIGCSCLYFVFGITGCSTTLNVHQEIDPISNNKSGPIKYIVNECRGAGVQACDYLKDHITYKLIKNDIKGDKETAERAISIKVDNVNTVGRTARSWAYVFAGIEEMDVNVEIVDRDTDKLISSLSVSHDNIISASEELMADAIADEILNYILSGEI